MHNGDGAPFARPTMLHKGSKKGIATTAPRLSRRADFPQGDPLDAHKPIGGSCAAHRNIAVPKRTAKTSTGSRMKTTPTSSRAARYA